ncbi:MAG: ABC transporter, permease protein 2 (cluster 1, maltose/g3p/polyamine/iron) [uncultured Microvirga sp.]|uniref:ABC transporter, permease protein 2 (Cluster 1, maltose/g3p/polyamine/iron) n=1 Tax=uncultured Microvirga sp. TaxID=412392 RepID=A0A6J4L709_9HYPH|nr:MAG: ABC transporter, permease protein 2 (cluster 1, maltose/g3p/polyamine/iron) [uncultured Microvirga sp.]
MDQRPVSLILKLLALAMFVFLLAPLIVVVPISFSGDNYMMFPPSSWSVKWYAAAFSNSKMASAFWTSLQLACVVTALSLLIGLPAAYALVRLKPRGADALATLFTAPLLLPTIVLGLAILIVFSRYGLLASFSGLVVAHLVVTLPYAIRVLSTALSTLPVAIEEAAATLGAPPLTVFRRVTLPLMRSGLIGAAALCFLVSFDEVVLSLFMTGPRISTLPVAMYHHVEQQADPLVASLSVLLVILTLLVVILVDRTAGLARTFVK